MECLVTTPINKYREDWGCGYCNVPPQHMPISFIINVLASLQIVFYCSVPSEREKQCSTAAEDDFNEQCSLGDPDTMISLDMCPLI